MRGAFPSTQAIYILFTLQYKLGGVKVLITLTYPCPVEEVLTAGNLGADWHAGTTTTHGFLPNPSPDFLVYFIRIYCTINRRFPAGFPF